MTDNAPSASPPRDPDENLEIELATIELEHVTGIDRNHLRLAIEGVIDRIRAEMGGT